MLASKHLQETDVECGPPRRKHKKESSYRLIVSVKFKCAVYSGNKLLPILYPSVDALELHSFPATPPLPPSVDALGFHLFSVTPHCGC